MNSPKTGLRVAGFIFGLVCLVHIWRLVAKTEIHFASTEIPMSLSVVGAIIAGALCLWLWKLSGKANGA